MRKEHDLLRICQRLWGCNRQIIKGAVLSLANTALVVGPATVAAGAGTLNAMGRAWEAGKVLNAGEIGMSVEFHDELIPLCNSTAPASPPRSPSCSVFD